MTDYRIGQLDDIWSDLHLVRLERSWWLQIMCIQRELGGPVPLESINASYRVVERGVDGTTLERIRQRERITRHDVKARLEIYCEDAGHEHHHLGLTSADVVENTYQLRIASSLRTLSRQFGYDVEHLAHYPLRGVHGAVGTDQDQIALLGSADAVDELNRQLCRAFGFPDYARAVGQVMHRSMDLAVLSPLVSEARARFGRSPWCAAASAYMNMLAAVSADTWNEGDVSHSVVRRIAVPNLLRAVQLAAIESQD